MAAAEILAIGGRDDGVEDVSNPLVVHFVFV